MKEINIHRVNRHKGSEHKNRGKTRGKSRINRNRGSKHKNRDKIRGKWTLRNKRNKHIQHI